MLIDAGWDVANGDDLKAGDVMRSIPGVDLPALVAYAGQRNIGLFVWVHWKALDAQMDAALAPLSASAWPASRSISWIATTRTWWLSTTALLESGGAAPADGGPARRLPSDRAGSRTWPNLLTQEGVMGA